MVDEELSAAVIDYVWGVPRKSWPTCRAASLSKDQARFLPAIEAAGRTADTIPPEWDSLPAAHRLVSEAVHREHPELSDDAVAAIANAYCYAWK